jgi:hypothetical protein
MSRAGRNVLGNYKFAHSVAGQFSFLVSCPGPAGTSQNTLTLIVRKEHHHLRTYHSDSVMWWIEQARCRKISELA